MIIDAFSAYDGLDLSRVHSWPSMDRTTPRKVTSVLKNRTC